MDFEGFFIGKVISNEFEAFEGLLNYLFSEIGETRIELISDEEVVYYLKHKDEDLYPRLAYSSTTAILTITETITTNITYFINPVPTKRYRISEKTQFKDLIRPSQLTRLKNIIKRNFDLNHNCFYLLSKPLLIQISSYLSKSDLKELIISYSKFSQLFSNQSTWKALFSLTYKSVVPPETENWKSTFLHPKNRPILNLLTLYTQPFEKKDYSSIICN